MESKKLGDGDLLMAGNLVCGRRGGSISNGKDMVVMVSVLMAN